ncbi:MAG: sulfatase family protein [Flavicella sp.]
MKTTSLYLLYAFVCIYTVKGQNKKTHNSKKQPNIIFMMSDDHSYKAISAYGYGLNNTPNIDRIASEGALFQNSFVTNSICAPSRAVMLTGKHSFINGKIDNKNTFNWKQDNIAKQLKKIGYTTALVGKIHLKGKPQGFDYSNVLPGQGQYYNPDFIENGKKKNYPGYVTKVTTDIAMDWLKNIRDTQKPFFLIYNQKAPHRTWMPEPKYFDLFDSIRFPIPETYFDNYEGRLAAQTQAMGIAKDMSVVYDLKMLDKKGEIQAKYRKNAEKMYLRMDSVQKKQWDAYYEPIIADFKKEKRTGKELALWKYQRYMQDYLSTIQSVDDGVGTLLDYLDANNLTENTIVIYTSDQGFYIGEHGWFDKRFMYEESFKTPFLMRYPASLKRGTVVNKMIQNLDYLPTLLEYAGGEIPESAQGISFRKLLDNPNTPWRKSIYYTYYEYPGGHDVKRHYGIRTERYKLIHFYHDIETWELYDLKKDPQEMHNLYGKTKVKNIQSELHANLIKLQKEYGDSKALRNSILKQSTSQQIKKKHKKKSNV